MVWMYPICIIYFVFLSLFSLFLLEELTYWFLMLDCLLNEKFLALTGAQLL